MKKILIHTVAGGNNRMFDQNERDAYNDPYIYLRERLHSLGYLLTTTDDNSLHDCAWVLFFDSHSAFPSVEYLGMRGMVRMFRDKVQRKKPLRDVFTECINLGIQNKTALFLWEPQSISKANWDPNIHEKFPVIFTWNDKFVDGYKYHKIYWPQTRQFPILPKMTFDQKKLLVNISMNKFSRHPRELYSERRATIKYFEQARPMDFDLYGMGWNQPINMVEKLFPFTRPTYLSYRGTVRHKWDVLPKYRFSVCYENIRDEPGLVTEKIFDSIRAGCVPIYWGAPNITEYVDKEAFIDRRKFRSNSELESYLIGITEKEYARFQDAMQNYLRSESFERFLPHTFADTIIRVLNL